MRTRIIVAAMALGCLGAGYSAPAHAIGCVSGGLAGGIAGHMAHHGVLGAVGGCVAGHEMHKHQERSMMQNGGYSSDYSRQDGGRNSD